MQLFNENFLIKRLESVDSTQKYAKRLIMSYCNNNLRQIAIIASTQTDGYGRLSRKWESIHGNLHLTLAMPVPHNVYDCVKSQISYVTGIAIGKTISSLVNLDLHNTSVKYKWVNDILINNKKVAGMLVEILNNYFIIGIGVNLQHQPNFLSFTDQSINTSSIGTTSIAEYSSNIDCEIFLDEFFKKFTSFYNAWVNQGFDDFRKIWKNDAYKIGEVITLRYGEKSISGIFDDITDDGAMMLKTNDGIQKFYAGDFYPS